MLSSMVQGCLRYGAALLALMLAHPLSAEAPTDYTFIDLGAVSGSDSHAAAINAEGLVVGHMKSASQARIHAAEWNGTNMIDLGAQIAHESRAYGINRVGQVVGYSYVKGDVYRHAILWTGKDIVDLNPPGGRDSWAQAINDSGQVTGTVTPPGRNWVRAFFCTGSERIILDSLGGSNGGGYAINSRGQIVGYSSVLGDGAVHATLWIGQQVIDLGALSGSNSYAFGINTAGQIAGYYVNRQGVPRAAIWIEAEKSLLPDAPMVRRGRGGAGVCPVREPERRGVDIGTLGGPESKAFGINSAGDVVGYAVNRQGFHNAFLYTDGKMIDLNRFLPAGSAWQLTDAYSINDKGWIVGSGTIRNEKHAFLLKPKLDAKTP